MCLNYYDVQDFNDFHGYGTVCIIFIKCRKEGLPV